MGNSSKSKFVAVLYKKGLKPTWKQILVHNQDGDKFFTNVGEFVREARDVGYPCVLWNGWIYEVTANSYYDTGWREEDIE